MQCQEFILYQTNKPKKSYQELKGGWGYLLVLIFDKVRLCFSASGKHSHMFLLCVQRFQLYQPGQTLSHYVYAWMCYFS